MAVTWNTEQGNLGTYTEREILEITLNASSDLNTAVNYSLIAGNLPRGIRLTGNVLKGSPVEVNKFTESRFVIRASDGEDLKDRTFSIFVDGADKPVWRTPEGFLQVGIENTFFVLDNSRVNFQLEATDTDMSAGESLKYFLSPRSGELPPGLSLSDTGLISGFTDPIFALEYSAFPDGSYDTQPFDYLPLDIVNQNTNGYDTFFYDNQNFDYNEPSRAPRRLSRIYTFTVGVTDGINIETRLFKIYVVTEEFLQADNSLLQVDTNLFTSDASSDRVPIWITESNLGQFRANNYVTIFLDVYDPPTLPGTITYFLLPTNPGTYRFKNTDQIVEGNWEISERYPIFKFSDPTDWRATSVYSPGDSVIYKDDDDSTITNQLWICLVRNTNTVPVEGSFWTKRNVFSGSQSFFTTNETLWETITPETASQLPPGMSIDQRTGEIAGSVPYQSRITRNYKFTVRAVNFPATLAEISYTLQGNWLATRRYLENDAVIYNDVIYIALSENRGNIPNLSPEFWLLGISSSAKSFSVDIIGEVETAIEWISDEFLGTVKPNQPSKLNVVAESLLYGGRVSYELVSGTLPVGLTFLSNGIIQGKVKQFADRISNGLTRFYSRNYDLLDSPSIRNFNTTFDGDTTTFDRKFTISVKAKDSINFAERIKSFNFTVIDDQVKTFANISVRALQNKTKRLEWYDFITNSEIFRPNEIYRYGDTNFGIQTDIKMLLFAGIESKEAEQFVSAMSRNHYRKRLQFGQIKSAKAKDPITQEVIYEAIFVELVDDFEKNNVSISDVIHLNDNIKSPVLTSYENIRIDSDIPLVSDRDHQRLFPNSIKNMRRRISQVGDRDREFLPLWMRSIQDQSTFETGYVKAMTLCYLKPGKSEEVLSRIKFRTEYASRGEWNNITNYTINDSVRYRGRYYTCVANNSNKIPSENTEFWLKNFDFRSIDFEFDRYIIDILNNTIEEKYLVFPQRDIMNKLENPAPGTTNRFLAGFASGAATFDNDIISLDADIITLDQE